MSHSDETDDVRTIKALIGAHFDGLRWSPGASADWERFAADFLPDASLFHCFLPRVRFAGKPLTRSSRG
jgi:hypothetical protein